MLAVSLLLLAFGFAFAPREGRARAEPAGGRVVPAHGSHGTPLRKVAHRALQYRAKIQRFSTLAEPRTSRRRDAVVPRRVRLERHIMLTFQQIILTLQSYWDKQGCALLQPIDMEVGAGTSHVHTFLRAIGPEPWRAAYVQPSRRPKDGRYGENPNRLQHYYQYQVVLKPAPENILDLYLGSLEALGFDLKQNDVRFVEDDWENPTLGAWGLGWEVWLNGMEVTQFTYFQQVGGLDCKPVLGEITYGLERLAMYLQKVENVYDLVWTEWEEARPERPGTASPHLWRRVSPERSRTVHLQLRARERRSAVHVLQQLRSRSEAHDRRAARAARL